MKPKNHPELTVERLRELLSYNPETGVFRWTVRLGSKAPAGSIAGNKDGRGYLRIKIDGKSYKAHRLAWFYVHGLLPTNQIDHDNGVGVDNWIKNLREATNAQNQQNRALSKNNSSKHAGSWAF